MKYLIRSVKYLILLCVLYVALEWIMLSFFPEPEIAGMSLEEVLKLRYQGERGMLLIAAFVGLAAFYPLFGFMKMRVDSCIYTRDAVRLDNAMHTFGFKLKEESEGRMVFRADNILNRLFLLFEDEIVVEQYGQWIDITGIRRGVAKVLYRTWGR